MKIVINVCYGGFSLSDEATRMLGEEVSEEFPDFNCQYSDYEKRTDPELVECVETIGTERASGVYAELKIVDIPEGVEYEIEDYDGWESIHEKHQVWG